MRQQSGWHVETIPYGKREIEIRIPEKNYLATLAPRYRPGLPDAAAAMREALARPIGTPRLRDLFRLRPAPCGDLGVMTGAEHLGHLAALPDIGARIVRILQQSGLETLVVQ